MAITFWPQDPSRPPVVEDPLALLVQELRLNPEKWYAVEGWDGSAFELREALSGRMPKLRDDSRIEVEPGGAHLDEGATFYARWTSALKLPED